MLYGRATAETVSILVLLEPPLILINYIYFFIRYRVSILVLLEPPLILCPDNSWNDRSLQFQSLFYWNLLSYSTRFRKIGLSSSFNPCFTGTSSHTLILMKQGRRGLRFQSLFYWNLLSYRKLWLNRKSLVCFNPCFTGTSSHTSSCALR